MSLIEDFKHMKWLPLAGGALLCVLGLTALVWPGRVAKILPLCIALQSWGWACVRWLQVFWQRAFCQSTYPACANCRAL